MLCESSREHRFRKPLKAFFDKTAGLTGSLLKVLAPPAPHTAVHAGPGADVAQAESVLGRCDGDRHRSWGNATAVRATAQATERSPMSQSLT